MYARLVIGLLCVMMVFAAPSSASADEWYPQVASYELDVQFFPDEARMEGEATIRFVPESPGQSKATFYLGSELRVDSLQIGGRNAEFESDQQFYTSSYTLIATCCRFTVSRADLDSPLTVFYSGYFHPSRTRSPSDYMRIDSDGVFLRAYGYSLWFPMFLPDRANTYPLNFPEVTIRTPAEFRTVFVGKRTGEREEDGVRISEWTATHVSPFAAQCTAQRYVVTSEGNYFLYHYDDPRSTEAAKQILGFASQINTLYEKYYRHGAEGGQFYIVEMPKYGDISSGNVTGLQSETWQSFMEDTYRQRALGHELVHPCVAVPVARDDSLWSVAIEGFPSFFHLPILAENLGSAWYNDFLAKMEVRYLEKRATGVNWRGNSLPKEIPLLSITEDIMSNYKDEFVLSDRVVLFLNYLYARMGKETFFTFTGDMLNRDRLTVTSFRELIEQYLPGSAADINLWLNTNDYPERLHFAHYERK